MFCDHGVILLIRVDMDLVESRAPCKDIGKGLVDTAGRKIVAETTAGFQRKHRIAESVIIEEIANEEQ
jgi:hypothetical protein